MPCRHPHIRQRNTKYHYRMAVPGDVRHLFSNRSEFTKSLRTSSCAEARRLAVELDVEYLDKIDEAREQLKRKAAKPFEFNRPRPVRLALSDADMQVLTELFRYKVEKRAEQELEEATDKPSHEALMSSLEEELEFSKDYITYGGFVDYEGNGNMDLAREERENPDHFADVVREQYGADLHMEAIRLLIEQGHLPENLIPSQRKTIMQDRRFRMLCKRFAEVHKLIYDRVLSGETIGVTAPPPEIAPKEYTVADLMEAHKTHPSRAKRSRHADTHYQVPYRLLSEEIGAERPLKSILRDELMKLIDLLQQFPVRGTTRFRKLKPKSLRDIVRIAKREGKEPAGPKAINSYLSNLSSLFDFAVREQMMMVNPAKGLRVDTKESTEGLNREPFSTEQLNIIFQAPLYTGCQNDGSGYAKSGTRVPRRGRFWVPLIALFTGMRLNEVCSLEVGDIATIDGIRVIKVQRVSMTGTKSLKTKAAERIVPIHSELVRLGFLTFVDGLPDSATRLFAELSPSKRDGKFSDPFSKWFSRFLQSCKAYRPETTFHSFRHGVSLALKNAEIYQPKMDAVMGWEDKDRMSSRYGRDLSASQLVDVVEAISYPGLDLSHLYPDSE